MLLGLQTIENMVLLPPYSLVHTRIISLNLFTFALVSLVKIDKEQLFALNRIYHERSCHRFCCKNANW